MPRAATADAKLLELCAAFYAISTSASFVPDEEDLAMALVARDSLAGRIRTIPPLSPESVRAEARVGVVLLFEGHSPGLAGDDVGFALTFLRDLATGTPFAGLEVTGPDAELLSACAAFDALEHGANVHYPGWRARARSLTLWDQDMLADYETGYTDQRLLAALLRDMAA